MIKSNLIFINIILIVILYIIIKFVIHTIIIHYLLCHQLKYHINFHYFQIITIIKFLFTIPTNHIIKLFIINQLNHFIILILI